MKLTTASIQIFQFLATAAADPVNYLHPRYPDRTILERIRQNIISLRFLSHLFSPEDNATSNITQSTQRRGLSKWKSHTKPTYSAPAESILEPCLVSMPDS